MNLYCSKVVKFAVACLPFFTSVNADGGGSNWNYNKQGKDWPDNFPTCANGLFQSPIDLIDSNVIVTKNL
jgi:hypothetical protein